MMIISPLIPARQSATVTVSDCCRISCAPFGAPVHGFYACASDYATVFTPVTYRAGIRRSSSVFSRLVYAIDGRRYKRLPEITLCLYPDTRPSIALVCLQAFYSTTCRTGNQTRPSNANLKIISPLIHLKPTPNTLFAVRATVQPASLPVRPQNHYELRDQPSLHPTKSKSLLPIQIVANPTEINRCRSNPVSLPI